EELEKIILKALAFDREERHATAADLEADLEAFLAKSPQVTTRDISKFVSQLFEEVRIETKRIIDQQMKRRATLAPAPSEIEAVPARPRWKQAPARAGYTATVPGDSNSHQPQSQSVGSAMAAPPSRTRPVIVAAVAIAVGVIGWRVLTQARSTTAHAMAA